jgi:hypothetical protein
VACVFLLIFGLFCCGRLISELAGFHCFSTLAGQLRNGEYQFSDAEPSSMVLARVQLLPCPERASYTSWAPTVKYNEYRTPDPATVPLVLISPRRFIQHAAVLAKYDGRTASQSNGWAAFLKCR